MTKICPDCQATVLSTSQPERMGTVTDEMVEAAWAAIVGADVAKTCFNASIIRADLKTGLSAALTATPAVDIPPCPKCHAPYHLEGAERYWEARWRDEKAENDRLRAATPAVGGEALGYATRLLEHFVAEHFPHNPDWKPLPDLLGVLTQIDNAITITRDYKARLAAPPASPLRGRDNEVLEEMRESGTVDAFEEADFAILYREIPESGTTTLQEITNVPQAFCLEIARLIASPPEQPAAETRQQKNEREMAEGSRCDGSCNDGMPCHCQPVATDAVKMYRDALTAANVRIAELEDRLSKAAFNGR